MSSATLVFFGLFVAGLVLVGFATKGMKELQNSSQHGSLKLGGWLLALLVLLLGFATASVFLKGVLPDAWGAGAYWSVLAASCCASAAIASAWTQAKQRRAPLQAAPVALPPAASASFVSDAAPAHAHVPGKGLAWPHPGLEAARAAVRANREALAQSRSKKLLMIAAPLAGLVGYKVGLGGLAVFVLFIIAFISNFHSAIDGMSESEYRTLPGSTDEHGKHHCVYCGRWGIYRQGAYASSSTWHECTSCRKHLFVN